MSSMPRDALKTRASKPGVIGVDSSRLRAWARAITSRGSEISAGGDLVYHLNRGVAQHSFGADVEQLNDALLVGGDAREVCAVKDRVLQRPRLQECRFSPDFSYDVYCNVSIPRNGRIVVSLQCGPAFEEPPNPVYVGGSLPSLCTSWAKCFGVLFRKNGGAMVPTAIEMPVHSEVLYHVSFMPFAACSGYSPRRIFHAYSPVFR